jgi:hypothetical protein
MSLANKTFKNNLTGENVTVIDSFENIAILENKQKIDVNTLMDSNKYTEQIDPSSFFNNQGSYNSLADKIKNIPVNNMVDEEGTVSVSVDGSGLQPTTDESAIIMTTEEDERAELLKKYGAVDDTSGAVSKQNEAFSKLLDEDDLPAPVQQPKTTIEVDNVQRVEVSREVHQPPVQRVADDPIVTMFKGVKRNVKFDINIEISDKIPRLDFIEMMEDSYEISLIDFLAEEFTNKILQNPNIIKDTITEKIKLLVYGAPNIKPVQENIQRKEKVVEEDKVIDAGSPVTVSETPKPLTKLSATQRVKAISKLTTVEMVKKALLGEKAKSVKEAGSKRIEELQKIIKM